MTVALDEATETPDDQLVVPGRPAGWWARAAAFAIDVLFPLGVVITALLVGWSAPRGDWLRWVCVVVAAAVLVAIAVNRWLLPAGTGWSLGRAVLGIAVDSRDGSDPGAGRLALRDLAHVVDTIPFALGWLWPLLDARGRTFADMLARTEVCEVDGPVPDRRRIATAVLAVAAALCVLTAGLGYGLVYRHQQSVDAARDQIAEQGPKLVSEMLSYTVKSAEEDFAHAQSLVTDGYRAELTAQQDAVKKNGLVDNDYWVSNSAVVSSSTNKATMLLLLQGQRGAAPKQRFVTASLRVEYEKVGGDWKVASLTVLAAPKSPPPPADAPKPEQAQPNSPASSPKPAPPKPEQSKSAPPKPSAGGR